MKWLLWIIIVLAGFLILITLIGYLLPKEHTVSREAGFHQPPEIVWKTITDIDAMPSWRQGLKSVKHLPDRSSLRIREDGEIYNPLFRFLARFFFGYTGTIDAYLKSMAKKFGEQSPVGN